jgi:hypothetical protein
MASSAQQKQIRLQTSINHYSIKIAFVMHVNRPTMNWGSVNYTRLSMTVTEPSAFWAGLLYLFHFTKHARACCTHRGTYVIFHAFMQAFCVLLPIHVGVQFIKTWWHKWLRKYLSNGISAVHVRYYSRAFSLKCQQWWRQSSRGKLKGQRWGHEGARLQLAATAWLESVLNYSRRCSMLRGYRGW